MPPRGKRSAILAVSAPRRLAGALAGVPTWREQGAEVVVDNMRGVVGPKALGAAQVSYWEAVFSRIVATEDWKAHLAGRVWVNSYTGTEGSRKALKVQHDQSRLGLTELGLAKN